MELIQLTQENIKEYLPQCLALQAYLVKSENNISAELLEKTALCKHNYFVGIVEEQKLVGLGVVSKIVQPVHCVGYVNNIVVHPDARGNGLFSVLMDALEAKAKEWGCDRMDLTCSRKNVQHLYEKRGYTKKDTHFYIRTIT